jgi:hypothetical protein
MKGKELSKLNYKPLEPINNERWKTKLFCDEFFCGQLDLTFLDVLMIIIILVFQREDLRLMTRMQGHIRRKEGSSPRESSGLQVRRFFSMDQSLCLFVEGEMIAIKFTC